MIGILGGYGEVGQAAVRHLLALGLGPLRIGGRDVGAARRFAAGVPGVDIEFRAVDVFDESSLGAFVDGCRLLLNCAGPSHGIGRRAVDAAFGAGADYVDAAGDDPLEAQLDGAVIAQAGRVALLSAGLQPGLTGLLPRWLALRDFDSVDSLTSYFGVMDVFTSTAADDYLAGAATGASRSLAAWRGGRRPNALVRRRELVLPFFGDPVTALPQLSTESERSASAIRLPRGDWYSVVSGRHTATAFDRVLTLDRDAAIAELVKASRLDLAGREPQVVHVVEMTGQRQGQTQCRTTVLRGRGNSDLTGAFAAAAVNAVLEREVIPGCHFAALAMEPRRAIGRLARTGAVACLETFDDEIAALRTIEEGAL